MSRQGVRSSYESLPQYLRDAIDEIAGARVVTATNQQGGFSPGPAARCDLADGRTVFVKAGGMSMNPYTPGMHRREAEVLSILVDVAAPQLIGVHDDGDWVALVVEWIDGRMPRAPLDPPDVNRLLKLVDSLANTAAPEGLASFDSTNSDLFGHWQQLIDRPLAGLDNWTATHLISLAKLEKSAASAATGDRLVHVDLRTDNVIFAAAGSDADVIVDWPSACAGAPWIDLVGLMPSLELDCGLRPEDVFGTQPVGAAAPPDAVDAFLAGIAGYFTRMSLLPAPPGLPTLRAFQAAQGAICRRWLASRIEQ